MDYVDNNNDVSDGDDADNDADDVIDDEVDNTLYNNSVVVG